MSNTEELIQVLTIIAACLVTTIIVLVAVYFYMQRKKDKKEKEEVKEEQQTNTGYTIKSIFDFMDFEKIEDVIAWMPIPEPYRQGEEE